MTNNFQREGSVSNSQVGRDFEDAAIDTLAKCGVKVEREYRIEVGVSNSKKYRKFDLGADHPPTIVECKTHTWRKGKDVPSAKMTNWNEAMYYFACLPPKFRKIFFVLRDVREKRGKSESLAEYYIRTYYHLIPSDVEIWEFDDKINEAEIVYEASLGLK